MLPCEAADRIAISRITSSESDRTAADVMKSIPTILETRTVREAAERPLRALSFLRELGSS